MAEPDSGKETFSVKMSVFGNTESLFSTPIPQRLSSFSCVSDFKMVSFVISFG